MAVRGRRRIAKTDPVPVGDVARPAHKTTAPVDSDLAEAVFAQTCDHGAELNAAVEGSVTFNGRLLSCMRTLISGSPI